MMFYEFKLRLNSIFLSNSTKSFLVSHGNSYITYTNIHIPKHVLTWWTKLEKATSRILGLVAGLIPLVDYNKRHTSKVKGKSFQISAVVERGVSQEFKRTQILCHLILKVN